MNYWQWNLNEMEEDTDLYDPVGSFKIRGNKGTIEENDTYLDAFFEAFIEGIERIKQENFVTIDPVVEPNDIVFNFQNDMLEIEYGTQKAIIYNKLQFIEEIQQAVTKFVTILDKFADNSKQKKRKLTKLRNFLST